MAVATSRNQQLMLTGQGTYYLLGNCSYQPDIGSFSRVILVTTGWYIQLVSR